MTGRKPWSSAGARVALVGRTRTSLDSAVVDLTDRGSPDALGFAVDIGDAAHVDQVFADVAARWDGELRHIRYYGKASCCPPTPRPRRC
jgi:hypothetical protein